jgi:hypothetical protein
VIGTQLRCSPSHVNPPTRMPAATTTATVAAFDDISASTPSAIVAPKSMPKTVCPAARTDETTVGYIARTAPRGA